MVGEISCFGVGELLRSRFVGEESDFDERFRFTPVCVSVSDGSCLIVIDSSFAVGSSSDRSSVDGGSCLVDI